MRYRKNGSMEKDSPLADRPPHIPFEVEAVRFIK
jgi:hypothetical protein